MKHKPLQHPLPNTNAGLEKYEGPWNFETAAHLLRRTTYGATRNQIEQGVLWGMDALVDTMMYVPNHPSEPINFYYNEDPEVGIGESWINKPFTRGDNQNQIRAARFVSLAAWTSLNLFQGPLNIGEKMLLFWHNHFVTQGSVVRDPNFLYYNISLLRKNALGNFRTMVEEVTINPAMLRYLNGSQNSRQAPNENYARELLELFTVGKGEQIGSGDYTTFTEKDVFEAAKVLTGWRDIGYFMNDGNTPDARFVNNRHDTSDKIFSNRLGNAIIRNNGDQEYKDLITIILDQEAVAEFVCRNLYRWFVFYDVTPEIEATIIIPLAKIFRENDYEIIPVIERLLKSAHFYEICSIGPMIKNPIDFVANLLRQFEVPFPDDKIASYYVASAVLRGLEGFDMSYYEPPNVAGWKAYYQEPLFYRQWITAATLPLRQRYTNLMASGTVELGGYIFGIDALDYISKFASPSDPNALIDELVSVHLPVKLSQDQIDSLKEILIPGLPDFEWTVEYNTYLGNPNDADMRRSVENKIRNLLTVFLSLAEYNLS